MKKKQRFINFLMPLIVLFAILFPVVHSYEHISNHDSRQKTEHHESGNKADFKVENHCSDQCHICHFKFSSVSTFTFESFQFYQNRTLTQQVRFYTKSYLSFFKGSLFALRAPPLF